MARYDVFARADGGAGYLLDCQADLLAHLNTRLVAPLLPLGDAPKPARVLNPVFELAGGPHVMATQFAAAVLVRELAAKIASLADRHMAIDNALDFLLTGA